MRAVAAVASCSTWLAGGRLIFHMSCYLGRASVTTTKFSSI